MFDHCLYLNTTALAYSVEREWTVAYAPFSLTPPQEFMLHVALKRPGVLDRELAEVLDIMQPIATRLMDDLIVRDLMGHQPSAEGGRERNLFPTGITRELETALQVASSEVARRLRRYADVGAFGGTAQVIRSVWNTLNV